MTAETKPVRVVAIATVPGPNLNDFFDQVAAQDGVGLTVLYCSRKTRKWREGIAASDGHAHEFPLNMNPFSRFGRFQLNPGVLRYLFWNRPDLIQIQGYTTPTLMLTLSLCWLFHIPFTYWGEEIDRSGSKRRLVLWVKRWVVRCLNCARHIFVVGTRGADSYRRLGLDHDRIGTLFYSCDLSPFFAVAEARKSTERGPGRAIVTTSQLIDRKRVDILIDAFVALADDFPDWSLNIIGAGPNQESLAQRVPAALEHRFIWHGYLAKPEHAGIYASSDIFALPSREDGGPMAMAEALAAGLPTVTTDGVVTAKDMVEDPGAGLVVPRDDLQAFKNALQSLMRDDYSRAIKSIAATQNATKSDAKYAAEQYVRTIKALA